MATKRISCRDLDSLAQIEDTELEDDRSSDVLSPIERTPINVGGISISDRFRRSREISIDRSSLEDLNFRPRDFIIPTNTPTEPAVPTREDALNSLDSSEEDDFRDVPGEFLTSPFLGLGRTTTIIDIDSYADSLDNITKKYDIEKSNIPDRVRYYNGSFYVLDGKLLNFYKNSSNSIPYIKLRKSNIRGDGTLISPSTETYKFDFENMTTSDKIYANRLKQKFINGGNFVGQIFGQNKNTFNFQGLDRPRNNITDNVQGLNRPLNIADNIFTMQLPFENSELLETLNLVGTSIIDVNQNYNFYIEDYEKIASKNNISSKENIFPNLYVLNAILEDNTSENKFLSSLANLDSRIDSGDKFILNKSQKVVFGIKDGIGEYFDLFGVNYENLKQKDRQLHDSFDTKMSNILFLSDTTAKMSEINNKKYLFPMHIDIAIPTDKTTNVTRMLIESELMDSFLLQLFKSYDNNTFNAKDTASTEKIYTQEINPNTQQSVVRTSYNTTRKSVNFKNINNILKEIKQFPVEPSGKNYVVIGDTTKYLRTNTQNMSFANGLRNIIFNSKLNTFVRNNHRTYKDILNGKPCYNETIAFRISKYNPGESTPIQNYWIANNPDIDFINLIDTQVKYEKEYVYKIFAYQFVLGNRIIQNINNSERQSDTQVVVDVENQPQANIFEVELLATSKTIFDTPPLSPEILFVPYYDVDNKIGLFLNNRTGQEKLEPISIFSQDEEKIRIYTKNLDGSVLYKSDDIAKRFEIMRLETPPTSYLDFNEGFIKIVDTDIDQKTTQKATAAAFIDTILPNKKYYYCFRTVDVHEKISNPTQIYEVEIINQNGMIYPIVKNYDFAKPAHSNSIDMRRFIKIKPSSQHAFLNSVTSDISSDTSAQQSLQKIKLGLSDVAVPWGKTFKMIVTSKQTGKKCEFKFKFKYISE